MSLGDGFRDSKGSPPETLGQQSTVYRELRARGMTEDAAMLVAVNCRRWWMNSGRMIHVALPNRYFDQLGVPRLAA